MGKADIAAFLAANKTESWEDISLSKTSKTAMVIPLSKMYTNFQVIFADREEAEKLQEKLSHIMPQLEVPQRRKIVHNFMLR